MSETTKLTPHASLPTIPVSPDWSAEGRTVRTVLTTHAWTAPPLERGAPAHDRAFAALSDLRVDYARFLPWFSHQHVSVAALEEPTDTATARNRAADAQGWCR
ncbi:MULTISPECIES: hypothetical protein [Prauserella salsuginis group]|uniref:Uncharacterized protein n=2 Tax=Prauserella salsuginis group TaxID=2893672 RepID=A0A839XXF6_9PSEU|nr:MULTISPECIES: hypothetical protein [Prauserella salsuginis group]MBB3665133.1 hypothetical protein [Prauserella sediminis]MCR3718603.1 hypothetical protein [Prauserella flava]MCR3733173.1 hypothetical protein [Prauserella salsuginis]